MPGAASSSPRRDPDIPSRRSRDVSAAEPTPAIPLNAGPQYTPASLADHGDAQDSRLPYSNGVVALSQGLTATQTSPESSKRHCEVFQSGILPLLGESPDQSTGIVVDTESVWRLTIEAIVDGKEMHTMFQSYCSRVHPFFPVPLDLDDIERKLCLFLSINEIPESHRVKALSEGVGVQSLPLLNAILASGAQTCDMPLRKRLMLSAKHKRLTFDALHATNYLSQPYKESISALLLLGSVLQNEMKPQAAWALAGTTIRLAQCLGIHQERDSRGSSQFSTEATYERHLRLAIVWQDSLLSMAFGRPPVSHVMDRESDLQPLKSQELGGDEGNDLGLEYREAMNWICHLTLRHLEGFRTKPSSPLLLQFLSQMDGLDSSLCRFLRIRSSCTSFRQVLQHHAFELHKHFVISTICRHYVSWIAKHGTGEDAAGHDFIIARLAEALRRSARAYLQMRSFSGYAHRSWAPIHNGLVSVLLLSLLRETRELEETKSLQEQLIDNLESDEEMVQDAGGLELSSILCTYRKGLSALKALRKLSEQEALKSQEVQTQANKDTEVPIPGRQMEDALQQDMDAIVGQDSNEWDIDQWLTSLDFDNIPVDAFDYISTDFTLANTVG